ncbi:Metalloenzyme, LuxS/M16 peptidase-like protein [Coemansia mojavensis]|nr:Metalloenzyme, LuxS/M16 peptidase-like protein [Coemansia mojavensis]
MQKHLWLWILVVAATIGIYRYSDLQQSQASGFVARKTALKQLPYLEFTGNLEKSAGDQRQHVVIKLPNNLLAFCSSDPNSTQAAGALSVNIGSFADPPELQGLAHFLEHMLFMGTEKYPQEGEYVAHIKKYAGTYNAFTSVDTTTYFFGIANEALEETLDRFSRFFIDPLLPSDSVDRELHAVDSEHKGNLQNDMRREFQIQRTLSNQSHPFSYYSGGNLKTLRDSAQQLGWDIREKLLWFYNEYYSADVMKLSIIGNYSIDELVEWAVDKFSAIESKGKAWSQELGHPLSTQLGKLIRYQMLGDAYQMTLEFALPELNSMYRSRPDLYVQRLLERRTSGSLLHFLRAKQWAVDIDTYSLSTGWDSFNIFYISISLTPNGFEQYEAVLQAVLGYLEVVVSAGPLQHLYEEMKAINDLEYRFYTYPRATRWVLQRSMGSHNQHIAPRDLLLLEKKTIEFNHSDILEFMTYFHPQNYRVSIGAQHFPDVELSEIEPHYGTPYRVDSLPSTLVNKFGLQKTCNFSLPKPNKYIPEDVHVVGKIQPNSASKPTLLQKTDSHELWFKQDDQFAQPYGYIRVKLAFAQPEKLPIDSVAAELLTSYLEDVMQSELGDAELAGLDASVSVKIGHVNIKVTGFSAKLSVLLETILYKLKTLVIDDSVFQDNVIQLNQTYQNEHYKQPFRQLKGRQLEYISRELSWHVDTLEEQLSFLTIDKLQSLVDLMFNRAFAKILVSGNFEEVDAISISSKLQSIIGAQPLAEDKQITNRVVDIEPGHFIHAAKLTDTSFVNGAVSTVIFCGKENSAYDRVVVDMLEQIIDDPLFDELRTKEQLGYVVHAASRGYSNGRLLLYMVAQSEVSPAYLTERIDRFIRDIRQHLLDYSDRDIASLAQSMINARSERLKSIVQEAARLWKPIDSGTYKFDKNAQEILQLQSIKKQDLVHAWDMYVNPGTAVNYTRIDMQLWSTKTRFPTLDELKSYPVSIISLSRCLEKDGIMGVGIDGLSRIVQDFSTDDIDGAFAELSNLASSMQNATTDAAATLSDRTKTALKMALDAQATNNSLPSKDGSAFAKQLPLTPDNRRIIEDISAFKTNQPFYSQPIPE